MGWGPQPLGFNIDPLVQKNITLQGSFSHNWPIWERVIALLASGQFDVRPIIGGVWPIATATPRPSTIAPTPILNASLDFVVMASACYPTSTPDAIPASA